MNNRWIKAVIATALIVLALATLFADCASLSLGAMMALNGSDGLSGLLSQVPALSSLGSLGALSGLTGDGGIASQLVGNVTGAMASGGFSLLELRGLMSSAHSLLGGLASMASLGGMSLTGGTGFDPSIIDAMGTASALILVALALALAAGIFGVVGAFLGRRAWGIPLAVMMLLTLVGEIALTLVVNSTVGGVDVLALTAWPFLGLALAVAAMLVCLLWKDRPSMFANRPIRASARAASVQAFPGSRAGNWTCPACGTSVEADGRFCPGCGAPKPEPKRCPGCGAVAEAGMAFCSRCGTPLTGLNTGFQQPQGGFAPNARQDPFAPEPQRDPFAPNLRQDPFSQDPFDAFRQPQASAPTPAYAGQSTYTQRVAEPGGSVLTLEDAMRAAGAEGDPAGTVRLMTKAEKSPLVLKIELHQDWANAHREHTLRLAEKAVIGRLPGCELQIADNTVSGRHLKLEREEDALYATDQNSANGTMLNGAAMQERTRLHSGDELILGRTRLVLHFDEPRTDAPAPEEERRIPAGEE